MAKRSISVAAAANSHSQDAKLTTDHKKRRVMVTMASHESCPDRCPMKETKTCYTMRGKMGMIARDLNSFGPASPEEIATQEAAAIDRLPAGQFLRLHTVGDAKTEAAVRILAAAAERWVTRSIAAGFINPIVYSYTHAWDVVPREAWGIISIMASCETDADVAAASARGYACELTRAHAEINGPIAGLTPLPCPQQTGKLPDCASCGACGRDSMFVRTKRLLVLDPHGAHVQLNKLLHTLRDEMDA